MKNGMRGRMARRDFLKSMGLSAAVAAFAPHAAEGAQKPNLVFILIDDMGQRDLVCYGHEFHETPRVDQLAREGMLFTDAYAACPVCSPTRASIMSGQYPAHVGVTDFITGHWRPYEKLRVPLNRTQYLPLECVTLAEMAKARGYVNGIFGKWHLGNDAAHMPDKQGFDTMLVSGGSHLKFNTTPRREVGEDPYLSEVLTDAAIEFISAHKDEPFCCYLHHQAVHIPLEARQALIEKYERKRKPAAGVNNPVYAAMVEHVDQSVGRVLDALDAQGLAENTIVVFFSDNGGLRQRFDGDGPIVSTNEPLRGEKGTVYEGGVRVPLLVRWPGKVAPGSVCNEPAISVDFYPTLLDIMGGTAPENQPLDGVSLLPALTQTGSIAREALYWHYPHYHHMDPAGAIRMGDWKLIEHFEDGRVELYNLREDLGESRDLAREQPEKARAMQAKLAAWRDSVNAAMPEPNPDHDPGRAAEWGTHPDRLRKV